MRRLHLQLLPALVYMLECADGSLYTGITNNLDRRMAEHAAGKGARYTKGRGPSIVPRFFLASVCLLGHNTAVPRKRSKLPDYAPERLTEDV